MAEISYRSLAPVYEWLIPTELTTPAGSARAFEIVTERLRPGARILDCSCGIGLLAVGLAEAGFEVTACDASPLMVERTQALARAHAVDLPARACRWDQLPDQGWQGRFDAVVCVGNSLAHAVGRDGRRAALDGMASVLTAGGALALTSRNWEQIRRPAAGWTSGTGWSSAPAAGPRWCTRGRSRRPGRRSTTWTSPSPSSRTATGCR